MLSPVRLSACPSVTLVDQSKTVAFFSPAFFRSCNFHPVNFGPPFSDLLFSGFLFLAFRKYRPIGVMKKISPIRLLHCTDDYCCLFYHLCMCFRAFRHMGQ